MQLLKRRKVKNDPEDVTYSPEWFDCGILWINRHDGSLFAEKVPVPPMDEATRRLILEGACNSDWSQISPTIFGAIFESTLNPDTRRHGGMHYTSIENIHKVIDPLFLDEYKEKFREAMNETILKKRTAKLKALQDELAAGQFFDPCCGW